MRIIFFGTSAFAAHVLSHLAQVPFINIVAVVTRPDRPQGRSLRLSPSAVKVEAMGLLPNIPLMQPEKASTEEFASELRALNADVFVVVAYGEIIKQNILSLPTKACINIHASLLPRYRGAAPIQRCIMAGEKETGITIIEMVRAMDAGPMIGQVVVPIDDSMLFPGIEDKLRIAACEAVDEALKAIKEDRVVRIGQREEEVTYAPKLLPEEEKINWDQSADKIHNLIRAFSPKPGAWCDLYYGEQKKRLKIIRSNVRQDLAGDAGKILVLSKNALIVACGEGALELLEVQLEGKKALPISDFLRGSPCVSFSS